MPEELGALIRRTRLQQKLSQNDLAMRAGLSNPVVSWSETGREKVSRNALQKILSALGLDHQELLSHLTKPQKTGRSRTSTPPVRKPAIQPAPAEARTGAHPERTANGPPYLQPELSAEERIHRLIEELERELTNWSRMSPVRKLQDGTWQIPPATKPPNLICQENTRTETYTSDIHRTEDAAIELRQGLLIVEFHAWGEGTCRLSLAHHKRALQNQQVWGKKGEHDQAAYVCYIPVTDLEVDNAIPTGKYRLEADGDCRWDFTWTQPAQNTGHIDIVEDPDTRGLDWSQPGIYSGGPTAPTRDRVKIHAVQAQEKTLFACAYPVDASSQEIVVINQPVGPTPVTLDSPLDPDKEYFLQIHAQAEWDMFFSNRDPVPAASR